MLNNYNYDGFYRDNNFMVSVTLTNPNEIDINNYMLTFDVLLKSENNINLANFSFYIIDCNNNMHNMVMLNNNCGKYNQAIVHTKLQPIFLYNDIRIAFYYKPYNKLLIIDMDRP